MAKKITPEMYDDIILWRTQNFSWRQIAQKLAEDYNIDIRPSSVYEYYKRNLSKLEGKTKAKLKEKYEDKTGNKVEDELVEDIEVLNLAIQVGKEILEKRNFKTPHQYQATVSGIAVAIKTKSELVVEQESKAVNPLLEIFMDE
jgi:hypothetical protein